jgi:glycosyltransferase involved in cell wall biosynthesis
MERHTKSLIVEGWRFVPHSYAVVNQWQLLALLRRDDIAVRVVDAPLFAPHWLPTEGLFDAAAEQALRAIPTAAPEEAADVTLRMSFPLDLAPSRSRLTAVFGTCEAQALPARHFAQPPDFAALRQMSNLRIVTPSRWSAAGFYAAGFGTHQVCVVPHGIDVATFHPGRQRRLRDRARLSLQPDDFVFLSVGGMASNKGIDVLLAAFAEVLRACPRARLVLKGLDTLYASKDLLAQSLAGLPASDHQGVVDALRYVGDALSNPEMAFLYQAADVYVAPYRAEAFCIPVLEAAACGLPVICTRGGSTDDFVTDAFARRIDSKPRLFKLYEASGLSLEPARPHLVHLMTTMVEDADWRRQAAVAGPAHVGANYTWDQVVDGLVRTLWS